MSRTKHFAITISIFLLTAVGSYALFTSPLLVTRAERVYTPIQSQPIQKEGKYVVVHLNNMLVELHDGDTLVDSFPIISQGKPGSYYETIGGEYANDYKEPLHFSSIGHVYMPYSVHVYGQYFIHGIPYYPNGEKVSSAYSGGCVRLADIDAKKVYDFVEKGTPIIISRGGGEAFINSADEYNTLSSQLLTNYMVGVVSLETLPQDAPIIDTDGRTTTTRKKTLPRLIKDGDNGVALLYANSLGEEKFVELMNKKAKALGLTNTMFDNVISPVSTTFEDYARFKNYVDTYKSYLRSLNTTSDSL